MRPPHNVIISAAGSHNTRGESVTRKSTTHESITLRGESITHEGPLHDMHRRARPQYKSNLRSTHAPDKQAQESSERHREPPPIYHRTCTGPRTCMQAHKHRTQTLTRAIGVIRLPTPGLCLSVVPTVSCLVVECLASPCGHAPPQCGSAQPVSWDR